MSKPLLYTCFYGLLGCIVISENVVLASEEDTSVTNIAKNFKTIRYEEDFSYLKNQPKNALEKIKYIPLTSNLTAKFGGSIRERFENHSDQNFGVPQADGDGYLIHRLLIHTEIKYKDRFRFFAEIGNTITVDKVNTAPPYKNSLDLQQAFIEFNFAGKYFGENAYLRTGRQEIALGSQRVVSIRDAPGVRRSFDGVRFSGEYDALKYHSFYSHAVQLRKGTWNDKTNKDETLWGVYLVQNKVFQSPFGLDLYYLGLEKENSRFSSVVGEEKRHSIGARLFGSFDNLEIDSEALYQFGDINQQSIQAWGLTIDGGYYLNESNTKKRLGLKITASSGDDDPNDNKLTTYNGLYPRMAYFNQAGLLGSQNIIDIQPSITFYPKNNLKLTFAHDFLWRQNENDAVYTAGGVPISNTAGKGNRYISGQSSIDLNWQVKLQLNLNSGLVYVDVSDSLEEAGGKNNTFSYLGLTYNF